MAGASLRSMPQVARRHAVDVGQPPVGGGAEIDAGGQFQQAIIGAIGDRDGQRLLVEGVDITADDRIQEPAQRPLLGIAAADFVKFLLKGAEGPQAVVLLREPRIKVVHVCLFNQEKKLPVCNVGAAGGQMIFLQVSVGIFASCATMSRLLSFFSLSPIFARRGRASYPFRRSPRSVGRPMPAASK